MHVDPAGRVAHQHRGRGVQQVVPAYDGPRRGPDHRTGAVHEGDDLGHVAHPAQGRRVGSAAMSVRRVMGTETEFGISVQGQPTANPMVASSQVVNAYASSTLQARRARWDFEEESPLRDARGFDMSREVADPSQLTDEDLGLANVILTNGARLYVDHAHPEYSTPGVHQPARRRALGQGRRAGDARRVAGSRRPIPGATPILLYKNNTDNKGASYGAHENYLMRRQHAVRRHRAAPDAVLRHPPGGLRRRPGRHRPGRPRARLPDQPARRLLRGRGRAWRPRSSGRSSTPATSRTPTRRSTAGCT